MKVTEAEIDRYLALLGETVGRIETAVDGLETAMLHTSIDDKSWSINEILAHLRCCVDVWGETIDKMLAEKEPTLRYLSPRSWMKRTNYHTLDFEDSFAVFRAERAALLDVLRPLAFEGWLRGAELKGRRHTIFSQVRRMGLHEAGHCEQIEQIAREQVARVS